LPAPSSPDSEIAIIDDEASVCGAMRDVLEAGGYGVEVFSSAKAFLANPGHGRFKCLIVNITLPGMSSTELQAELKLQPDSPQIIFSQAALTSPWQCMPCATAPPIFGTNQYKDWHHCRFLHGNAVRGGDMNDREIRAKVIEELEFEPRLDAAHIGVAVTDNIVPLSGHVSSYTEKLAAEQAAKRVKGIYGVAQEIEVRLPSGKKLADDEIAARAVQILDWDSSIPAEQVQVKVRQGWVTLAGKVGHYYQNTEAEHAVHKLSGVKGIRNCIEVTPVIIITDVKQRIDAVPKRNFYSTECRPRYGRGFRRSAGFPIGSIH
jgi:osmotically-inducible protein OsmY